jgi:hypothetical protein
MATTYIQRTQANGTSSQKFTVSCWLKRSGLTSTQAFWGSGSATNDGCDLVMSGTDELSFESWDGSNNPKLITTRKFRDISGWYNIVCAVDTTQATAADRIKIYVNGVQETSFSTANYPSQNYNLAVSTTNDIMKFGAGGQYATSYWNGSMSYVAFVDGTQELPGIFGETDATTGEWEIKTTITPSVAWGTNGCLLLKDGNSLTDESGNANNFTVAGGTLTNTKDCPDNVFATLNPLLYQNGTKVAAPTKGNTTFTSNGGAAWGTLISTIGATTGKYYCEAKCATLGTYAMVGICDMSADAQNSNAAWYLGQTASSAQYGYNSTDGNIYTNDSNSSYGTSFTTGDIMGIAMDLDNSKLYFSKNGVFQNSGVPTSGSTGTGAVSITADKTYGFGFSGYDATVFDCNFGNGYFGTTAVASAGTNASGNGIFEYDTPTGYTALSTKGLNL